MGARKKRRISETMIAVFHWSMSRSRGLAGNKTAQERISGHRAAFSVEKLGLWGALLSEFCHGFFDFLFAHPQAGLGRARLS